MELVTAGATGADSTGNPLRKRSNATQVVPLKDVYLTTQVPQGRQWPLGMNASPFLACPVHGQSTLRESPEQANRETLEVRHCQHAKEVSTGGTVHNNCS